MNRLCVSVMMVLMVAAGAGAQVAAPPSSLKPPEPARVEPVRGAPAKIGAPASAVPAGPKVDLHPKWVKGDVATYEFEIMNRSTGHLATDETKRTGQLYRQNGRMTRRVEAVDAQGVTLVFTIQQLHLQASYGQKVVHYDSDFGDDPARVNELTGPVKMCVNRPVTIRLNASGEVDSVEGNEAPPPELNKESIDKWQPVPVGVLGTVAIKKVWKPLFGPDKKSFEAAVGEKWDTEETSADPSMGTFVVTLHNELTPPGVKDGIATIATTADVELFPATGPSTMRAKLTGSTVTGTTEWDTSRGTLRKRTTSQAMTLDAEPQAGKMKMESELTTSFTFVDPNAKPDDKGLPAASTPNAPKPVSPSAPTKP